MNDDWERSCYNCGNLASADGLVCGAEDVVRVFGRPMPIESFARISPIVNACGKWRRFKTLDETIQCACRQLVRRTDRIHLIRSVPCNLTKEEIKGMINGDNIVRKNCG